MAALTEALTEVITEDIHTLMEACCTKSAFSNMLSKFPRTANIHFACLNQKLCILKLYPLMNFLWPRVTTWFHFFLVKYLYKIVEFNKNLYPSSLNPISKREEKTFYSLAILSGIFFHNININSAVRPWELNLKSVKNVPGYHEKEICEIFIRLVFNFFSFASFYSYIFFLKNFKFLIFTTRFWIIRCQ
jgi:hypothetical protein